MEAEYVFVTAAGNVDRKHPTWLIPRAIIRLDAKNAATGEVKFSGNLTLPT